MLWLRNKKITFLLRTLNERPEYELSYSQNLKATEWDFFNTFLCLPIAFCSIGGHEKKSHSETM